MYVLGMYLSHLHSEVNRNYEIQTEFTVLGKWPRLCRRSNPSLRHRRMPMVCSRCRMWTRPHRRRLELLKLNNHAWDITQKLTGSYLLGIFKHAPYALTESLNVFENTYDTPAHPHFRHSRARRHTSMNLGSRSCNRLMCTESHFHLDILQTLGKNNYICILKSVQLHEQIECYLTVDTKKIDYSMKENPEWPEVFKYQNKALTV